MAAIHGRLVISPRAHASQTPDRYYALQDQVARFRGSESGFERAEAFVYQQQSPFDIFSTLA